MELLLKETKPDFLRLPLDLYTHANIHTKIQENRHTDLEKDRDRETKKKIIGRRKES